MPVKDVASTSPDPLGREECTVRTKIRQRYSKTEVISSETTRNRHWQGGFLLHVPSLVHASQLQNFVQETFLLEHVQLTLALCAIIVAFFMEETDVIISGAGPSGLALGVALALRSVRVCPVTLVSLQTSSVY